MRALEAAGIAAIPFHDFGQNPDSAMVEAGRAFAAPLGIDSLIGLGGGSSLDCAKGINFLLTNGGTMADYRGYGKAQTPLLPMIGVPTTAGTGSEAQSYAVISDASTHMKMACGDPSAAVRIAILDPELTMSAPGRVTAMAGYDAIAHAVETWVTTRRTPFSETFSRRAWELLSAGVRRVMTHPGDRRCARRDAPRLPLRWHRHRAVDARRRARLLQPADRPLRSRARPGALDPASARGALECAGRIRPIRGARWISRCGNCRPSISPGRSRDSRRAGGLGGRLQDHGVPGDALPDLAGLAAEQWTGTFNPRPFDAAGALEIYRVAY